MLSKRKFEKLFDKYVDDVSAFLSTYSSDKNKVKDWVQEVFVKMWEKREQIDFDHPGFKSYLLKTARHHALKSLHRDKKYDCWLEENLRKLTSVEASDDPQLRSSNLKEDYTRALNKISLRSRRAYLLSREEGLTYSEIAEVMEISVKTVETHIGKALNILRKELQEYREVS